MSKKRNRNNEELDNEYPPKKKQKLEDEPLETENDDMKISLCMHTKLGESQKIFDSNDLQKITYFKNQLSQRWNNINEMNNICTIKCNDLCFSIAEVEALVFYKKSNKINIRYPFDRLIYFCNASDYFAETIESNTFATYFEQCIPAIKYQHFLNLKLLCQTKQCENLSTAIHATIKQINDKDIQINNKIIRNWKSVPIQLLISNPNVAVTVFSKYFMLARKPGNYGCCILKFVAERSINDLCTLWSYILDKKLHLVNPNLLDRIYKIKDPRSQYLKKNSFIKETGSAIAGIVTDVLQICLERELKYENYSMISNVLNLMQNYQFTKSNTHDVRKSIADKHYLRYDFFFAVLKKLVSLRRSNRDKFVICFGDNIILKLLSKQFGKIGVESKYRNFITDLESLKVDEEFRPTEQYQLLNCMLNNYQTMDLQGTNAGNIIKRLIEIDYDQSFKLTKLWFPIFMNENDSKNWIINELPQKTSLKTLQILIEGICDYITSTECKKNGCDNSYIEFVNQYTNVQWNVSE
eukprot:418618_1